MSPMTLSINLNTVWVVLTGAMVFFMEGGFALLEAGFIRSKNHVSIVMKVLADLMFGVLAYFVVGFGLMFGKDALGLVGTSGFALTGTLSQLAPTIPHAAFWFFQAAFTVAAVSIVSGAVAERMNFKAYLLYVLVMTAIIYPISGHWVWGAGGWLGRIGMEDFAGSAVIHAMAGFSALVAAQMVGARLGKYNPDGSANVFPPSNIPLAAVGTFILWFGWFGFNAGSTLDASSTIIAPIAVNTLLASVGGGGAALLYTLFHDGKADVGQTINGVLVGLVAITAGCAYVPAWSAIIIGAAAGVLMILATNWIDRLRVDDPVGAVAVHGVGGLFGTIMVGVFATHGGLIFSGSWRLLGVETLGGVVLSAWGMATTYGALKLIGWLVPLRVTAAEEKNGLDLSQHNIGAVHVLIPMSNANHITGLGPQRARITGVPQVGQPVEQSGVSPGRR